MENIDVSFFMFPVKLICRIAFGWASSFCCLHKSIGLTCNVP